MADKAMGEMIAARRKEKGMTQKELAERMNVTDKAVSKRERDTAYPDIGSVLGLAELLTGKRRVPARLADLILKAIPLGVTAAVAAQIGERIRSMAPRRWVSSWPASRFVVKEEVKGAAFIFRNAAELKKVLSRKAR